jgi:SAM-dependent methyltransferase
MTEQVVVKTYTKMRSGLGGFLQDARRLYVVRKDVSGDAANTRAQINALEQEFTKRTNKPLKQCDVLIVGSGQTSREVHGLGVSNRVTAIDLDVIPQGWKPGPYLALLKQNGPVRFAKTVGRKALGIDRKLRKALDAEFGIPQQKPRFLQMDASAMTFATGSFDLIYSFSVFEHLPDPKAVLHEVIRALRPGGVFVISTHIYSAEGGCHDLRIFAGDREGIPYWAQLRPSEKSKVVESCYMNEWRLDRWRELFVKEAPGVEFVLHPHEGAFGTFLNDELARLRIDRELSEFTDEELLTVNLQANWTKPVA